MFKIFYDMKNDIVEKSGGNNGFLDMLQKSKFTVYTEMAQIRGEKIDAAYIPHNEKTINQLAEIGVKKMSIFSTSVDNVTIPKNYVKVSVDKMVSLKNCYNIVLNNKNYSTDIEFIIQGEDDAYTDVARNVYILYGNVITSTWSKYDMPSLKARIAASNLPNFNNIYVHVYTTLEGLKKCVIKKFIFRVNSKECYTGLQSVIEYMKNNPDKIICNNVGFKKISQNTKYTISDNLIIGKYDAIMLMYYNAINMLHNKMTDIRKRIRLEFNLGQILAIGYLMGKIDFIQAGNEKYIKEIMLKYFYIFPLEELGQFYLIVHDNPLTTQIDKDLYDNVCEVTSINDL